VVTLIISVAGSKAISDQKIINKLSTNSITAKLVTIVTMFTLVIKADVIIDPCEMHIFYFRLEAAEMRIIRSVKGYTKLDKI
jgi:hypothetical protein